MTTTDFNGVPIGYKYTPDRYGNVPAPDVYTNREITAPRPPSTPNRIVSFPTRDPNVDRIIITVNDLSAGLGSRHIPLTDPWPGFVQTQLSNDPLDARYVDSIHETMIRRFYSTPSLNVTTPTDPSVRAVSTNSGTGTTATGNAPTGMTAGDILTAWVIHDDASKSISAIEEGWELKGTASPGATGDFSLTRYQKIATSADVSAGSWDWTLSASERWRVIVVATQDGADAGEAVGASAYAATATRFYLPASGAGDISPTPSSSWDIKAPSGSEYYSQTPLHYQASSQKQETSQIQLRYQDSNLNDRDILMGSWVIGPLAAQTINAQTIKLEIAGAESDTPDNLFVAWTLRAFSSDGATVRGTLVPFRRDGTEMQSWLSGGYGRRGDSVTSTSVTVQDGDYLVLEVGAGGDPGSGSSGHDIRMLIGDNSDTDLTEGNAGPLTSPEITYNPWLDFASGIELSSGVDELDVAVAVTRAGSLVLSIGVVDQNSVTWTGATDSGGSLTEELDSAAASISAGVYSESVSAVKTVTHTLTRSSGATDIAAQIVVIPPANYGKRLSHVNIFGKMAVAQGDADLIREVVNGSTPSLESTAWSPGSVVNQLNQLIIGGRDQEARLAVSRMGAGIAILSDLSSNPALADTMSSDTEPGFGVVNTSLYDSDIFGYGGGGFFIGSRNSAITQTLSAGLTNVPNGGALIGELRLPGFPSRMVTLLPLQDCGTDQAITAGVPMKVTTLNLLGFEPEDLWVPFWASAGRPATFMDACIWQNELFMTDGERIVRHDGRNNIENWPGARPEIAGVGQLFCRGFWRRNEKLAILVQLVAFYGGSSNTLYWIEERDHRNEQWYQCSPVVDSGTLGNIIGADSAGGFPFSAQSNVMYWHDDSYWTQLLATDLQRDPFDYLNGISGAGPQYGFQSVGSLTTPVMIPRGADPCVVSEITYLGPSIGLGGTGAYVEYEVSEQGKTSLNFGGKIAKRFHEGDYLDKQKFKFPKNTAAFNQMQIKVTAGRGANTNKTPQAVPFEIQLLHFKDGKVKAPIDVLGVEWANSR